MRMGKRKGRVLEEMYGVDGRVGRKLIRKYGSRGEFELV